MIGASFAHMARGTTAPPIFDLATDNLSMWLRSEGITGDLTTLVWNGTASAGTSATHALDHYPGFGDEVTVEPLAIDGKTAVVFPGAGLSPRLTSVYPVRDDILGALDYAGHSYTLAIVLSPESSSAGSAPGGFVDNQNPSIFDGEGQGYFALPLLDVGGDPKVGVYHLDANTVAGGTPPVSWAPGWGSFGLLWVRYDHLTQTVRLRINGSNVHTGSLVLSLGASGAGGAAGAGTAGGGTFTLGLRIAELAAWPAQSLSDPQVIERETYFASRFPSLGL